jgi:predicted ABC-type ATPase
MKRYTIIGGVNGVGKSSLTGVLLAENQNLGTVIDTDKINASFGGDKIKGGKKALALIDYCLEKGINFTQETTLSGRRTLKTIKRAIENDYVIYLYYVGVNSYEESISRIANRVKKGGHSITDEDVIRRYNSRFKSLADVLPYCQKVYFYDNENGFVEVAQYQNNQFTFSGQNHPKWLDELCEYLRKE